MSCKIVRGSSACTASRWETATGAPLENQHRFIARFRRTGGPLSTSG
jgi:hypothetical protein